MKVGDRVKLILDKEVGPDNRWHGLNGTITSITSDFAAGDVTGNPLDSPLFQVQLDNGETPDIHFRFDDLVRLEEHEEALRSE